MNLVCVSLLLCLLGNCFGYDDLSSVKFRSGKVKQIWEKATRSKLSDERMTELYQDLRVHDEMVMQHKHSREDDNDGTRDAELRERLLEIMAKYGLGGKKPMSDDIRQRQMKHRFVEDPKLDKLWKTAQKDGKFSKEELDTLKIEFHHHKRKLEELEILRSEISDIDDLHDNSVEKQMKQDEKREKKQRLAELYGDIEEGYERLNLKTKQRALSEEDNLIKFLEESVPFTEPRVAQLWEEAQQGEFSEEELESIKEELRHFETRIQKHLFFKEQLQNSMEKIEHHGGEDQAPSKHRDAKKHLQQKVQDLAKKVKKLHSQLSEKLSSGAKDRGEL